MAAPGRDGNSKKAHMYVRSLVSAFLREAIDAGSRSVGEAHMLTVERGDGITSRTEICGRQGVFRDRAATRRCLERTGDLVEVIRIAARTYRIRLVGTWTRLARLRHAKSTRLRPCA